MKASLQQKGIFYTGTCLVVMFVLPGGGLFDEVAELAEYAEAGREAEYLFGAKLLPSGSEEPAAPGDVSATAEAKATA